MTPYAAGAGIGVLEWFTFATAGKPIGVTTPFESTAAALAQKLHLRRVNEYVAQAEHPPALDWAWMLTAGIALGSYLAGGAKDHGVPRLWARRFGPSPTRRHAGAFLAGATLMFGARMAKGCTSGHGISGNLQGAASSWLFSAVFGVTAIAVARKVFGR